MWQGLPVQRDTHPAKADRVARPPSEAHDFANGAAADFEFPRDSCSSDAAEAYREGVGSSGRESGCGGSYSIYIRRRRAKARHCLLAHAERRIVFSPFDGVGAFAPRWLRIRTGAEFIACMLEVASGVPPGGWKFDG